MYSLYITPPLPACMHCIYDCREGHGVIYREYTECYSISFLFLFFFHQSSLYPIKIFAKCFYLLVYIYIRTYVHCTFLKLRSWFTKQPMAASAEVLLYHFNHAQKCSKKGAYLHNRIKLLTGTIDLEIFIVTLLGRPRK